MAALILHEEPGSEHGRAEVAVILGAAVRPDGLPSPVLEGRLEHGVALYRAGAVQRLLFTGGRGDGQPISEASAGRIYALSQGVPAAAILLEERSHTTQQNLVEAKVLMDATELRTALLVSDPLHLPRALRIASDAGINARPSPTPTTRFRSLRTRLPFLLRETLFLTVYWLTGR